MLFFINFILLIGVLSTDVVISLEEVLSKYRVQLLFGEREYRKRVLQTNVAFINSINRQNQTYQLGITPFILFSYEEWSSERSLRGFSFQPNEVAHSPFTEKRDITISKKVDWREAAVLTPVMNQLNCGSCYAVAAAEISTATSRLKNKDYPALSIQDILECSQNNGCDGGTINNALNYIKYSGTVTEAAYPYQGKYQFCKTRPDPHFNITDYSYHVNLKEAEIAELVSSSVVAAGIYSSWQPLQHYVGGILSGDGCNGLPDHAVVIVGYDELYMKETRETIKYWIIKNSWGSQWGEEGFFRIRKDYQKSSVCSIGFTVSTVTVWVVFFNKSSYK